MNVAFRVDASSLIGTGHFMRCLTLADELKQRGARIHFVSRHLPGNCVELLATGNYKYTPLIDSADSSESGDDDYSHWLGTSQQEDAEETIRALSDKAWDWLVVDHYALSERWETPLRKIAKRIFVIDDLANRSHDCDVLLDQNFYEDMDSRYIGKVSQRCSLLLGPRYAVLREEFYRIRQTIGPRFGAAKRILVFFGGVDRNNFTAKTIGVLKDIQDGSIQVDVVLGAQHPFGDQIKSQCADYGFVCHVQSTRMADLMGQADVAIGAGGVATWERCCLGLPTLTICTAENQHKQIADAAGECLVYAPDIGDEWSNDIQLHMKALMGNSHLRHLISRNGMKAVDGRGVSRVVAALGFTDIEIREARQDDEKDIFEWRNDRRVRAASRGSDMIGWEQHQKWFASVLRSPDRVLLIGERNGVPVGVVRFDISNNEAEVSIYLVPGMSQSGQGQELLRSAERWLGENRPSVMSLVAEVRGDNERSERLFLGSGYVAKSRWFSKGIRQ